MPTSTKPEPGPKPKYLVVENKLKAQTDEGEISLDLRLPIKKLEILMDLPEMDDKKLPRFLMDNIIRPEEKQALEDLQDGAEGYAILMQFMEKAGERLGASLGESGGSTDSSESTEQPSGTTSELASE